MQIMIANEAVGERESDQHAEYCLEIRSLFTLLYAHPYSFIHLF